VLHSLPPRLRWYAIARPCRLDQRALYSPIKTIFELNVNTDILYNLHPIREHLECASFDKTMRVRHRCGTRAFSVPIESEWDSRFLI